MDELVTVKVRLSDFKRCNVDLDRLEDENEQLRELIIEQRKLAEAVYSYWSDEMNQKKFNMLMKMAAKVDYLFKKLEIEVS